MDNKQKTRLEELTANTARNPEEEAVFVALTALQEAVKAYEEAERILAEKV